MRFSAASVAVEDDLMRSITKLCERIEGDLTAGPAHLATVFFTSHFEDEAAGISLFLSGRYPDARIIGCSGEGVIGPQAEHERVPAVALCLAHLPGVTLTPFHMRADQFADVDAVHAAVREIAVQAAEEPAFLLLADPFSTPVNHLLAGFHGHFQGCPVFGGMVSGCDQPDQAAMLLNDQVHHDGAIGLAISGAVDVQTVVSQGCRPIGEHFIITKCQRNVLIELGGRPALHRLKDVLESLSPDEVRLAEQALFVGQVINEYQDHFKQGDFLIRNLLAIDPDSGAIAVGDEMRRGATVQFHVRDHGTADDDLRTLLNRQTARGTPAGAFLFSCNGRGTRMWSRPNHDVSLLREVFGSVPTLGFFAAGEIGPVGGKSFIHGHTASIALFRPPH